VFKKFLHYQKGDRIVAFDGSSVPKKRMDSHVYWIETSKTDIPYGRLSYSSLYLRPETIHYYIDHILDTKPAILRGYPSFLNGLSEYILEREISIPFNIKGIQLTAENAYEWQIYNIKKAFNTKVFLQYGHSEVCVYGYTFNETYEYYCSPFYGHTEVLDADGKQVAPGEIGEVVVTGFYNFAMPFIRYRTGDMAIYNGKTDGIVKLAKITGRTQDYIITNNGNKVAITALIFGQHFQAFKNILKWQLQQDLPGKVKVKIIKGPKYSSEDELEIQKKFQDICDINTEFEYVGGISLTPRGKFKFFIQNMS
jgi:phenylacetate-CoA ligase